MPTFKKIIGKLNNASLFFVPLIVTLLAITAIISGAIGGIKYTLESIQRNPITNGYVEPPDLGKIIDLVQDATVTVICGDPENYDSQGSGWSVLLTPYENSSAEDKKLLEENPNSIMTNHHVIEKCIDSGNRLYVRSYEEVAEAFVWNYDENADLALLLTSLETTHLYSTISEPAPGFWVMAAGSPHGLDGSLTFGHVINTSGTEVYSTAALSPGNSGGPLVDNEGNVIATNVSFRTDGQNFSIGQALDAACVEIIECGDEPFWYAELID
jgi:S1-C subfamily serine protease